MKYKLVEIESEEHETIKLEEGPVLKGPIENVLLVVIPDEQMKALISVDADHGFYDGIKETLSGVGFDEEFLLVADSMKFAKFERVEDDQEEHMGRCEEKVKDEA